MSALVKYILFPLHEKLKGHNTVRVLRELERTQYLKSSEIDFYQKEKLKMFIKNVTQNVPYYSASIPNTCFDKDGDFKIDCFKHIPFLSKDIIRHHFEDLKNINSADFIDARTGGSTGEPLKFLSSKNRTSHDIAARWRSTRWWGVDIGDPEVVLWGSPIEVGGQGHIKKVRDFLFNSTLLPAFNMSEHKIEEYLKQIKKIRPKMLFAYPSALAHMAQYACNHDIKMDQSGIIVAIVTSEVLYPWQRELIQSVFGCGVANEYGGRDSGFIARECPKGNMHITADDIIVEIVDSEGNILSEGNEGEIVITHLETSSFPFIRYKTGDIGIISPVKCACGIGLPVLEKVVGRSNDLLYASDGARVHPNMVNYVLREIPGIVNFKVIQKENLYLQVFVAMESKLTQEERDDIVTGFKERLGQGVMVDVKEVSEIEPEKSGKHRYVVNEVVL